MSQFIIRDCPESYQIFPYDPDMENGRTNAGGFDLVRNPEDLEKIQEIASYPWLRGIILQINRPDGLLKSYGCEFVQKETHAWGYIDFAIRDHSIAKWWMEYASILKGIEARIISQFPHHSKLFFERTRLSKASIKEDQNEAGGLSHPIYKLAIEYDGPSQDEANDMWSTFFCKFEEELISIVSLAKLPPE